MRDDELAMLRERLGAAEHELEDLRAIRDALTPAELPHRPGLELAAAFIPAAEHVSGDFYLVAAGPRDSTLLIVGDVVGHGLTRRQARGVRQDGVRGDRPLLGRPVPGAELGEHRPRRACRHRHRLRHRRVRDLPPGGEAAALVLRRPSAGPDDQRRPRARRAAPGRSARPRRGSGVRRGIAQVGILDGRAPLHRRPDRGAARWQVVRARGGQRGARRAADPSPSEAVAMLRTRVGEFAAGSLTDDLCMLAARIA